MNDRTITVFLADDHTIVRQGLASMLEGEPRFKVVGEAKNGREAVSLVNALKPEIVIMDISMPLLNGIEATRLIKKNHPQTKVIILSMHTHDRYIAELFNLGVGQDDSAVVASGQGVFDTESFGQGHLAVIIHSRAFQPLGIETRHPLKRFVVRQHAMVIDRFVEREDVVPKHPDFDHPGGAESTPGGAERHL